MDVDEDGNGGDDMYDMLRYGVMGAPGVFDYKGSRRGECGMKLTIEEIEEQVKRCEDERGRMRRWPRNGKRRGS